MYHKEISTASFYKKRAVLPPAPNTSHVCDTSDSDEENKIIRYASDSDDLHISNFHRG